MEAALPETSHERRVGPIWTAVSVLVGLLIAANIMITVLVVTVAIGEQRAPSPDGAFSVAFFGTVALLFPTVLALVALSMRRAPARVGRVRMMGLGFAVAIALVLLGSVATTLN